MATDDQSGSPMRAVGDIKNYVENGAWVKKQRIPGPQTQLLFNLAMPTNVLNRTTRVGSPGPIVIEKLMAHQEKQDAAESCSSSLRLSVLSEDQLQAAVRLAQKDLRRKRQESKNSLLHRTRSPSLDKNKNDDHQLFQSSMAEHGQSPPTRDPGPKAISSEPHLSKEIYKLQKELETYVKRIEQLVNKGQIVESVEPDEKRRIEIRQQEQAARSARIIYVLQQQVKEIQQDLEKLHSQSVRATNKSRAVNRLAAAHRGAVRAMQGFIQQLSDPAESRVPVQCKELGQLIRQLSLCSAKLDVGQGSAVPETTLDILQKLEMLELVLHKQDSPQDQHALSISPVRERTSRVSGCSTSNSRFPKAQRAKAARRPKKSSAPKKNRRTADQPLKAGQLLDQERKEVLKVGIQNLLCMQELREAKSGSLPETDIPKSSSGAAHPDKSKPCSHVRDAGFQQPTVSSKLRESQLPQRAVSVPWIPTSPHSAVKHRAVSSRPEPRCLFSPMKDSSLPSGVQGKSQSQEKTSSENIRNAQNEALSQAWPDAITENRERELNHLSEEDMGAVQRVRAMAGSPTLRTKGAMQATRDTLQPLLDCVQTAVSTDIEATAGAMQGVSWEHDALLQNPVLENMLLRMEEIEKDEEEVRRRFAMISYSDPLLWDIDTGTNRKHNNSRPASPQPIRLTKPAQRCTSIGDIVLKKPVETGVGSESSLMDEEPPDVFVSGLNTFQAQRKGGIQLNVPCSIKKNVQKYQEEHDSYLRRVSHAAVGSFKPWTVAESLAEELIMEALADVATEFQDVCEEYAEAIFTSEFLQPTQPPFASVS
ncbi:protein moonraker isoform X1 [Silurus asotus]|uniref:Protein moonraker isoform X1 n=1 Tax=Silurus asotus TaxID=30991 RepID=A0AAD5B107_SILAS|nr:protein moonraker isoform X1 [Silurus asotus]